MKRTLLFIVSVLASLTMSAVASVGETVKIDGLWYSLFYDQYFETYEAHVTNGNKGISDAIGDIVIPETVEYEGISYRVTEISSRAFYDSEVTSVVIPNSVRGHRKPCFPELHITDLRHGWQQYSDYLGRGFLWLQQPDFRRHPI